MTTDADLVALLLFVADSMEQNQTASAGVIRVAARRLRELAPLASTEQGCVSCGGTVTHPRTGRRRLHCTSCRASRAKLRQTVN